MKFDESQIQKSNGYVSTQGDMCPFVKSTDNSSQQQENHDKNNKSDILAEIENLNSAVITVQDSCGSTNEKIDELIGALKEFKNLEDADINDIAQKIVSKISESNWDKTSFAYNVGNNIAEGLYEKVVNTLSAELHSSYTPSAEINYADLEKAVKKAFKDSSPKLGDDSVKEEISSAKSTILAATSLIKKAESTIIGEKRSIDAALTEWKKNDIEYKEKDREYKEKDREYKEQIKIFAKNTSSRIQSIGTAITDANKRNQQINDTQKKIFYANIWLFMCATVLLSLILCWGLVSGEKTLFTFLWTGIGTVAGIASLILSIVGYCKDKSLPWVLLWVVSLLIAAVVCFAVVLTSFFSKIAFADKEKTPDENIGQLSFISNGDGTCYVSGIGTYKSENLVINAVSPDGDKVTGIGSAAFKSCENIISVTIPSSVTKIESDAFEHCVRLVEVYNLSSLNIAKSSEDNGSVGLYALNVYTQNSGASKIHKTDDGYVFYADEVSALLLSYTGTKSEIVLPADYNEQAYSIYKYAFNGNTSLASVTVPNGVTSIEMYAFAECNSLVNINIPSSITSIGLHAFENCKKLRDITIPKSVNNVNFYAFNGCDKLNIYTELKSKPSNWSMYWNPDNRPVKWGYTAN